MSPRACIGLGSNQGDRRAHLDAAIDALHATPEISDLVVSPYHQTTPIGGPAGQGYFLNAAASFQTRLDPFRLHQRLQAIEADAGRVRSVRWGERPLDLDLLLYGEQMIETEALTVPHPRLAVRRFVLEPLAEVAAHVWHPETHCTIQNLLTNLNREPRRVALLGWDPATFATLKALVPDGWILLEPSAPDVTKASTLTFIAAPDTLRQNRAEWKKSYRPETPLIFLTAGNAEQEFKAACLAVMPISQAQPG